MDRPPPMMPSEELVREEIATDILLWCNEYALALHERDENAAAAAVNLMGKHLAKRILERRCSTSGFQSFWH